MTSLLDVVTGHFFNVSGVAGGAFQLSVGWAGAVVLLGLGWIQVKRMGRRKTQ